MDPFRPLFKKGIFPATEEEIRTFAFDMRKLFLADRAKHLAICTRCQNRLEYWTGLVEEFDQATTVEGRRSDA